MHAVANHGHTYLYNYTTAWNCVTASVSPSVHDDVKHYIGRN